MNDIQSTAADTGTATATMSDLAGKYLGFLLGDETYGLQILTVQEIIGMMEITRVPRSPHYVRGVVNLRGRVLPVIELRAKFEMDNVEDTERTCIIVVQVTSGDSDVTMGIIVDAVSEVMQIPAEQIEPPPALGSGCETDFILGMGKIDKQVVMLVEVEKILGTEDFAEIGEMSDI